MSTPAGTIGVIGGTGPQGRGLAYRFGRAGLDVVIGSRDQPRAEEVAARIAGESCGAVTGMANADCAAAADVAIVAVPYSGHADLLTDLQQPLAGTIVVDCVNPLGFDKSGAFALEVPQGSAAQQAAALLSESRVVAAFHHISALLLEDASLERIDCDVLVLGDDRDATNAVQQLVETIPGMRGIYAGRLRNARQVEAITANLISVNRRYKAHASFRVTGV